MDTLTVTAQHFADVRSAGADLTLSISEAGLGARSSGRIAELRARLAARGFAEADLALVTVDHTAWAWLALALGLPAAVGAGLAGGILVATWTAGAAITATVILALLRLGTLSARVSVRCGSAEAVGRALDLAVAERGVSIEALDWRFQVDASTREEWVALAIAEARARAARIAGSLGVQLLGLHGYEEAEQLPLRAAAPPVVPVAAARSKARMTASQSLAAAPSGADRAGVTVTLRYRIGPQGRESCMG